MSWVLASGIDVPWDSEVAWPTATFVDGRLGGSTGCNRYTAAYATDGGSLELGPIATTRMACPPPADAIERAYLAALEEVTAWRLEEDGLALAGADGAELLRFVAAPAS